MKRLASTMSFCQLLILLLPSCGAPQSTSSQPWAALQVQKVDSTYISIADLSQENLTPVISQPDSATTTFQFTKGKNLQFGINASFFDSRSRAFGATVSDGKSWSQTYYDSESQVPSMGLFSCRRSGGWRCGINFDYRNAANNLDGLDLAFTGYIHLVKNGQIVTQDRSSTRARTAIGVSKDGRKVIVVSVPEGANPDATYVKVAESLLAAGAYHGINLDGGGSTALVVKNAGSFAEKIASTRSPPVNFGFK